MIHKHVEAHGHRPVTITVPMLRHWWRRLNQEMFCGVLKAPQLRADVTDGYDVSGLCWPLEGGYVRIEIEPQYATTRHAMLSTLAHEMVHQYQHQLGGAMHHGESFECWREPILGKTGLTI